MLVIDDTACNWCTLHWLSKLTWIWPNIVLQGNLFTSHEFNYRGHRTGYFLIACLKMFQKGEWKQWEETVQDEGQRQRLTQWHLSEREEERDVLTVGFSVRFFQTADSLLMVQVSRCVLLRKTCSHFKVRMNLIYPLKLKIQIHKCLPCIFPLKLHQENRHRASKC